ncbi:MAG: site-specific integrase [Candidatus Bathyarchaeia archaeon]
MKNGLTVQRWLCRTCGYRFTQPHRKSSDAFQHVQKVQRQILNSPEALISNCQGSNEAQSRAPIAKKAVQTLVEVETRIEKQAAGATEKSFESETRQKLVEFAWWMKKQGYADETIRCNVSALKILAVRGADIHSPESVKEVIAKQKWSANRRKNVINAYTLFLKMHGATWDKPKCTIEQKIPFIPTEQEINSLIAGSGKKLAALLQLLKETAMRAGEAVRLEWTDIDFERRIITLNKPEKRSNPRMWRVSNELIAMLKNLPKNNQKVFGDATYNTFKQTFQRTRKRLAYTLQNPRLEKITLHTFRHWKATMLYHQTKDPYYVKQFLGHKTLKNTEIYITVEKTIFGEYSDEFTVKVATKPDEIKALLESGFVCQKDDLMFFRKRK